MVQEIMVQDTGSVEISGFDGKDRSFRGVFDALDEMQSMAEHKESDSPSPEDLQMNNKRQKIDSTIDMPVKSSPLGLKLRKTPSLLDLIAMKLSEKKNAPTTEPTRNSNSEKRKRCDDNSMKATNISVSLIRIGTWEKKSRYEADLVAKFYFAKRKLVWEILDGTLKRKIEIQWGDISAIRAICIDDQPSILEVELRQAPQFFKETNTQPRKHTLWEATGDFTSGQATMCRRHYLKVPEGFLEKHYRNILRCDERLSTLSQKPFPSMSSPNFETQDHYYDLNLHKSKSPPVINQPSSNRYPSQFPHVGIPKTLNAQHLRTFEPISPLLKPTTGVMGMNSQRSDFSTTGGNGAMNPVQYKKTPYWDQGVGSLLTSNYRKQEFQAQELPFSAYTNPVQYKKTPYWDQGVGSLQTSNTRKMGFQAQELPFSAYTNPVQYKKTPYWDQGVVSLQTSNNRKMGFQAQELPFTAYTSPVPNFLPRRVSGNNFSSYTTERIQENLLRDLEERLLSDPHTFVHADEKKVLAKVNSIGSLLNMASEPDSQPEKLRGTCDGEYNYDQSEIDEDLIPATWLNENFPIVPSDPFSF